MRRREGRQGFSLIEVLIAVALIALVLGSVILNNVRLAALGTQAEVQALQASAAQGVAQLYAHDLPPAGEGGGLRKLLPSAK